MIAAPLTYAIRKEAKNKITWTAEFEEAYSSLKSKLAANTLLQLSDLARQFTLKTDASSIGIGTNLLQEGREK